MEALTLFGVDSGEHYWVTNRRDLETDRWAEKVGLRVVRYEASGNDHSALLDFFNDLLAFVPPDDRYGAPPVLPETCPPEVITLPSSQELMKMEAEQIRTLLNQKAAEILSESSPDAYQTYDEFSKKYDEAIYRAWYTSVSEGKNKLMGYQLNSEVAHGAFGRVYRATGPEGTEVAIKVLHESIRRHSDLLFSFRRGVRSMRILSRHNVDGMVAYREAYEIPACVVMDWVDGPDLGTVVTAKQVDDWASILKIGVDIADIVRRGHALPERVLHRDLRPSNVMLDGFYSGSENWEVLVLDFDLSWHRGAFERSVVHGSTLLGYLAPEQIEPIPGVSTRHASVDSFGLGMTLFFMISGRNPVPEAHRHMRWVEQVQRAADQRPCGTWRSVPRRFARLIQRATQDRQAERWDMAQIQGELQRMLEAVKNPEGVESAELMAEEIASRCDFTKGYTWDDNRSAAIVESPSGVRFEIRGDESNQQIHVLLTWGLGGVQGRRSLGKWIEPASEAVANILRTSGWKVTEASHKYASIRTEASLGVLKAVADLDRVVETLDRATQRLRFD